jgi:hypothetical protein
MAANPSEVCVVEKFSEKLGQKRPQQAFKPLLQIQEDKNYATSRGLIDKGPVLAKNSGKTDQDRC